MKHFQIFLVFLGVLIMFIIISYFPFSIIYDVGFRLMLDRLRDYAFYNAARLRLTLVSLIVAAVLVLLMWLLRKATRHFNLILFERILTAGMFYVSVMTILMLTGMWLDYRISGFDAPLQGGTLRIGFVFCQHYG